MRNPIGIGTLLSFGLVSSAHVWPLWKPPEECRTAGSLQGNQIAGRFLLDTDKPEDLAISIIIAAIITAFINFQFRTSTRRIDYQMDHDEVNLAY